MPAPIIAVGIAMKIGLRRKSVKIRRENGEITRVTFKKKSPFMPVVKEHIGLLSAERYEGANYSEIPSMPYTQSKLFLSKVEENGNRMGLLLKEHGLSAILSDLSAIPEGDAKELDRALRSGEWEFQLSLLGHYVLERKR